jgi:hypothetical protein
MSVFFPSFDLNCLTSHDDETKRMRCWILKLNRYFNVNAVLRISVRSSGPFSLEKKNLLTCGCPLVPLCLATKAIPHARLHPAPGHPTLPHRRGHPSSYASSCLAPRCPTPPRRHGHPSLCLNPHPLVMATVCTAPPPPDVTRRKSIAS